MDDIVVELDAWVIPDTHSVYKVSAGRTYRFYQAVLESNMVFPDVRGLASLEGSPADWSDDQILQIISGDRWERELESRARHNKPKGSEGISQADRATLTFLKRIWHEGKKGDLVVVPPEGYDKNVLIGRLLDDAGSVKSVDANDGEYYGAFYGRRVKWVDTDTQKLDIGHRLIRALHSRAAIFTLGETEKEDVYRLAYGNFVYKSTYIAEFVTTKEKFTAEDHAVVSTWLNGLDALRYSIHNDGGAKSDASFETLGLMKIPDAFAAELRIDIQSPGEIFVRTKTPHALSIMALFALASCGVQPEPGQHITVKLKSVAGAAKATESAVNTDVNALSVALGDRRGTMIAQGKRAADDALVTTKATLKEAQKKRK